MEENIKKVFNNCFREHSSIVDVEGWEDKPLVKVASFKYNDGELGRINLTDHIRKSLRKEKVNIKHFIEDLSDGLISHEPPNNPKDYFLYWDGDELLIVTPK